MNESRIVQLISRMTLEEKAAFCSGQNNADTKKIGHLGIPSIKMHDGPNGMRKQDETSNDENFGAYLAVKATCFPSGCALASSWDVDLMKEVAQTIAQECLTESLSILLGPSINIKRSPTCGRNFEYLSEDPFLAGKLAAAYITALQKCGVSAGIKHFAANNQETRRQTADMQIDERTLREIYLTAFEIAVKESKPQTLMCAYNRLNGDYCSEHQMLLHKILRSEWNYDGMVMSDWGGVNDRVLALKAGLDLEMPYSGDENTQKIIKAVISGELDENILDISVKRILHVVFSNLPNSTDHKSFNVEAHHLIARKACAESAVLLKNHSDILPLSKEQNVLLVGEFVRKIKYQGGGAAYVRATMIDNIESCLAHDFPHLNYVLGYRGTKSNHALLTEAVEAAKKADAVIILAGLPAEWESEAFDRKHMSMPQNQIELIEAVAEANRSVVVVLCNGSPIEMPWADNVDAILEMYLSGQALGGGLSDLLSGRVNPSGKLAESFPLKYEHNPAYLNFANHSDYAQYREGLFVGYRYYTTKKFPVRFPFGYGLSYTTYSYSDLQISSTSSDAPYNIEVSVTVKNCGKVFGKEIVQLYVHQCHPRVLRPNRELKGFSKVALYPGKSQRITFSLNMRSFAYYNDVISDWCVDQDNYTIMIGASSEDIRLQQTIDLPFSSKHHPNITLNTTVGDVLTDPKRGKLLLDTIRKYAEDAYQHYTDPASANETCSAEMLHAMFMDMPIRGLQRMTEGRLSEQLLEKCIEKINSL